MKFRGETHPGSDSEVALCHPGPNSLGHDAIHRATQNPSCPAVTQPLAKRQSDAELSKATIEEWIPLLYPVMGADPVVSGKNKIPMPCGQ
jgi:hypothetical protein